MPTFRPSASDYLVKSINGKKIRLLSKAAYSKFTADLLGLGSIGSKSIATDAIAAVFDLQGFTNFCKQPEPQLAVPVFLRSFLPWLMTQLRREMRSTKYHIGVKLYSPLPFFVKFLGDGLLVVWDSTPMSDRHRRNIVVSMANICETYRTSFRPKMRQKVANVPAVLRCGLARGMVCSVGDGQDFVGSCINIAARLQKQPGLTFAFNLRGFELDNEEVTDFFKTDILRKEIEIRGIGDGELIGILKAEFEKLKTNDREEYRTPGAQ